jgi:hypothetical protein
MIFPSPSTADALFVMFTDRMRNELREKVWWLVEIVFCEVYEVTVRIYFISEKNQINNFVTTYTHRTVKNK